MFKNKQSFTPMQVACIWLPSVKRAADYRQIWRQTGHMRKGAAIVG